MSEYKNKCCECKNTGSSTFARVFYTLINGKWSYLCNKCWGKHSKKLQDVLNEPCKHDWYGINQCYSKCRKCGIIEE